MQDYYVDARVSRFDGPKSLELKPSLVQVGYAYDQESDEHIAIVSLWELQGHLIGDLYLTLREREELIWRLEQVPCGKRCTPASDLDVIDDDLEE